jgi:predicted aspartyl protease
MRAPLLSTLLFTPLLHAGLFSLALTATAQAAPSAATICNYKQMAALDLSFSNSSRMPAFSGTINGKSVSMLMDTGAYKTYLLRAEMDRQQILLSRVDEDAYGLGGRGQVWSARPDDVTIGGAHARRAVFPVVDAMQDTSFGAIIGADFLLQADLEIALADKKVKFFKPENCGDRPLAYWDAQAQDVPLVLIPNSASPIIEVEINGKKIYAMIDTGASRSVIDVDAAKRMGITAESAGVTAGGEGRGLGNGALKTWNATFGSFTIGGETIKNPRIAITDFSAHTFNYSRHEMLLGQDFLKAHRILIANSQQRLYFSYLGGPVFLPAQ